MYIRTCHILANYRQLLKSIQEMTQDSRVVAALLSEIAEDMRREESDQERLRNEPATEDQIKYLEKEDVIIEPGMTRGEASEMIESWNTKREEWIIDPWSRQCSG
jgi:hypothetical protein